MARPFPSKTLPSGQGSWKGCPRTQHLHLRKRKLIFKALFSLKSAQTTRGFFTLSYFWRGGHCNQSWNDGFVPRCSPRAAEAREVRRVSTHSRSIYTEIFRKKKKKRDSKHGSAGIMSRENLSRQRNLSLILRRGFFAWRSINDHYPRHGPRSFNPKGHEVMSRAAQERRGTAPGALNLGNPAGFAARGALNQPKTARRAPARLCGVTGTRGPWGGVREQMATLSKGRPAGS